jgi:hypothetical protein
MSNINTNGIDVNYPVPGVNNTSQGFRDNFTNIKTNLDTAYNELTDLQNKVIVKGALNNSILNNDMANTLISNALVRSFRASMYNLGAALSGLITINVSLGDVQTGTVVGNTTLQFGGWAPTGTQSNVELVLNVSSSTAVISFPTEVTALNDYGVTTLENYQSITGVSTVTVPNGVTQVVYRFSSLDCGVTIYVEQLNRSRKTAQVQVRTPLNIGAQGDKAGTTCVDGSYLYVCTGDYNGTTVIWKRIALTAY